MTSTGTTPTDTSPTGTTSTGTGSTGAAPTGTAPQPPRIAVVGPFGGPRAQWGELLTEAIAALRHRPVRFERFDDRGDAERAAAVAAEVVRDGRFAAVVGHFNSLGAQAALPVYRAAGLPLLLPLATAAGLLGDGAGGALRFCPDDAGQAAALAREAHRSGERRLVVAHDDSGYGRRLAALLADAARELGLTVQEGGPGEPDTALALCGVHHRVADLLRRHRPTAAGRPVLVPDDCDVPEFAELAGPVAARVRVARVAGGPSARVTEAVATLSWTLTKHPGLRGDALLDAVRRGSAHRFDAGGDLADGSSGAGWEVEPVRPATARTCAADGSYEAAVVGAGIVGAATAAELAEGGARVVLLDAGVPGATVPSGGLVRAYEPGPGRDLALASFRQLWGRPGVAEAHGYHRTGALTLLGPEHLADARAGIGELHAAGIPAELLDPAELVRRWPDLTASGLAGAVWEPEAGHVTAAVASAALRDRTRRAGVTVLPSCRVETITAEPDGAARLHTDTGGRRRKLRAGAVVVAAGCATPALLGERLAGHGPARTKRIRYGIFARGGRALPGIVDLTTGLWARPDGPDGLLAGYPAEEWDVPAESGGVLTPEQTELIRAGVGPRLPFVTTAELLTGVYGTDLYLADGPALGVLPGLPPTVVAAGWSGGGFKTAPEAARRAAAAARALLAGTLPARS